MRKYLFLFLILLASGCKEEAVAPLQYWYENIGSRTDLPYLPEGNVNYFMFSFKRAQHQKIGIRFKAKFPNARYMSYHVYDNSSRSAIANIIDTAVKPSVGGNPFRNEGNGEYILDIVPSNVDYSTTNSVLYYDDKTVNVGIILRYYVPVGDNYGSVPLPDIEAFDVTTDKPVALPTPIPISFNTMTDALERISTLLELVYLYEEPKDINFLRFAGLGLYPNKDNNYVFAPLSLPKDKVAIIRFRPPSYAASASQNSSATTRYHSICLSNSATYNFNTLADFQMLKATSDGFVNIVIARDDAAIKAKAAGLNFLEWKPEMGNKGFIIYRNLSTQPDFPFRMELVPDFFSNLSIPNIINPEEMYAHKHIGDYAPIGKKMSKEEYLENYGGFPVSF